MFETNKSECKTVFTKRYQPQMTDGEKLGKITQAKMKIKKLSGVLFFSLPFSQTIFIGAILSL